jgi:hypothetical protein
MFIRSRSPGFRGQCISLSFRWHTEYTHFLIQFIHTHTHRCENRPEENLLFIIEALMLIVIMSRAICRQVIKVFPALTQNFGSHKSKDKSEAENRGRTVVSTQDTVFHQHGKEKLLSGYYAYYYVYTHTHTNPWSHALVCVPERWTYIKNDIAIRNYGIGRIFRNRAQPARRR